MGRNNKPQKARDEYREWLMEVMVNEGGGNCPELVKRAVQHFSKDQNWCQRFLEEEFYQMLYRIAQSVISEMRKNIKRDIDDFGSLNALGTWDICTHFEHVEGNYVMLGDMNKNMLIDAGTTRIKRGQAEIAKGKKLLQLANLLSDNQTKLRQVISLEQAMAIMDTHTGNEVSEADLLQFAELDNAIKVA